MADQTEKNSVTPETPLCEEIGRKARNKLRAQRKTTQNVWFGLGMMGLVGWSVVVPTLLGTALGIWLDARGTGSHSWTLMLLVAGLGLGCLNAWHWVAKEDSEIQKDQEDTDE